MTTEAREVLVVRAGWWHCNRPGCSFRRHFGTDRGALHGIAAHLRLAHETRVTLQGWAGPRRLFVREDA